MGAIIIKSGLPKNRRPWWHISNRLPRNPFDPQYPIEHLEYCQICKMDVDVQVEAANGGGFDVYRKLCKRCGKVMQYGMAQRHIVAGKTRPFSRAVMDFVRYTIRDRR